MNLRLKFVVLHTLLVSLILVVAMSIIYIIYSNTRNEDLTKRLWVQAIHAYQDFDSSYIPTKIEKEVLANSPQSAVTGLQVVVYHKASNPVYKLHPNYQYKPSASLLADIKLSGQVFFRDDTNAYFGNYIKPTSSYVIARSNDKYGLARMEKLRLIMFIVGFGAVVVISTFSFLYVMRTTQPLVELSLQMRNIATKASYAGQAPPINLFNPFAWNEFVKAWKRGDFKNKN